MYLLDHILRIERKNYAWYTDEIYDCRSGI